MGVIYLNEQGQKVECNCPNCVHKDLVATPSVRKSYIKKDVNLTGGDNGSDTCPLPASIENEFRIKLLREGNLF